MTPVSVVFFAATPEMSSAVTHRRCQDCGDQVKHQCVHRNFENSKILSTAFEMVKKSEREQRQHPRANSVFVQETDGVERSSCLMTYHELSSLETAR